MNDIDALPMELRTYINDFLMPQELTAFELINKNAAYQSRSSYYQISMLSWENKFKMHFREKYDEWLKKNKNAVKTIDWKKAFQKADNVQYRGLTLHQRHLFHLLKEETLQTQDLLKALENLAKEKRGLIDILLLNPIRDANGLTPASYAVKQKIRMVKNTFYQIIFQYYHQDLKKLDPQGAGLFHWAVYLDQSVEHIQSLIKRGADIYKKISNGNAPLHLACSNGHIEIVKVLLEKGARLNKKNHNHETPLDLACINSHIEIVMVLAEKGARFNEENSNGYTLLHWACEWGYVGLVRVLLENNDLGFIDKRDSDGNTPLHWVCAGGHIEIIEALLENGANAKIKNNQADSPFEVIDKSQRMNTAQKEKARNLLDHSLQYYRRREIDNTGINVFPQFFKRKLSSDEIFYKKSHKNSRKSVAVKEILLEEADATSGRLQDNFPQFLLNEENAQNNAFNTLVSQTINNPYRYFTSMDYYNPASNQLLNILNLFKDQREKILPTPEIALRRACVRARPKTFEEVEEQNNIIKYLIARIKDINVCHSLTGMTILHLAIKNDQAEITHLLLEAGADTKIRDKKGKTPKDYAIESFDSEIKAIFNNAFQKKI